MVDARGVWRDGHGRGGRDVGDLALDKDAGVVGQSWARGDMYVSMSLVLCVACGEHVSKGPRSHVDGDALYAGQVDQLVCGAAHAFEEQKRKGLATLTRASP